MVWQRTTRQDTNVIAEILVVLVMAGVVWVLVALAHLAGRL